MAWRFTNDRPVYIQFAERIKNSILSGEYQRGSQIPSVRQLALISAVNPNTVQHAFLELEDVGLIVSKGTLGRFVTEDESIIEDCRNKTAESLINEFLAATKELSLSKEQILNMIGDKDI